MVLRRAAVAFSLALAFFARPARGDDLNVKAGAATTLSGNRLYGKITIDGGLTVAGYDAKKPGTGWLWLRASELTIGVNGVIDARGSGYRGTTMGAEGFKLGAGGSPTPAVMDPASLPGGGGAHIGKGGVGVDQNCQLVPSADGGVPYDDPLLPLALLKPEEGLGSAGGTSHAGAPNPSEDVAGGNGGGVVILEAATMTMLGAIHADGSTAQPAFKASAGGGAGGTIYLLANNFTAGDQTQLTAIGGKGGTGPFRGGGSGGGGLIVMMVKNPLPGDKWSVAGGDVTLGKCDATKGALGAFTTADPKGCVDADRDGHGNVSCGGKDCNDSDDQIKPGQKEICNGQDDDCNGKIDDGADATMCSKGQVCAAARCVDKTPDSGVGGAPEEAPRIELRGGLCSAMPFGGRRNHGELFALAMAAIALARRRLLR